MCFHAGPRLSVTVMSPPSTHCWIRDWSALGRAVRVDAGAVARALPKRQLPDPRIRLGRRPGARFWSGAICVGVPVAAHHLLGPDRWLIAGVHPEPAGR